jgi:Tol biopolymer transport system component/predicted Ser/Thr protein kinase
MSLVAGHRLGPYEISGKLGEGGMGEVYKARDTRLGRTVAIKVLPAFLAGDPDLRARFEREARVISSLQHPHICTLFDVGREGDQDFLVMEYLEGEPLSARLARGRLSLEETIGYGRQIAAALDKAHRHGVVHRDLKPGNVILTRGGGVKLLDFGLAKLQKGLLHQVPAAGLLDSRTVLAGSEPLTGAGTVVGTPEYMSPEQLEGRDTDARCDLWALGCVLYQMVTGERPFARANLASVITAIMSTEPAIPPEAAVPPELERLIRFCLVKDPEQRWQSAYDLALELESLSGPKRAEGGAEQPPAMPLQASRRGLAQVASGLAGGLLLAALLAVVTRAPDGPPRQPIRFQLAPEPGVEISMKVERSQLAISPDGRLFAYVGVDPEWVSRIYLRPAAEAESRALPGTDGVSSILWSPDGKSLAFFATGKLKRLELSGGAPIVLCDVDPGMSHAGSWGSAGQIVYSVQGKSLMRVAATGGVPEKLLGPDPQHQEARLLWPYFLPDGRRILYSLRLGGEEGFLMLLEPGREPRQVAPMASRFELVGRHHLLFCSEGTLLAQRFDADSARLAGAPQSVAPEVRYFHSTGWAAFAASAAGSLVYLTAADSSRFYQYGRDGSQQKILGSAGTYLSLSLAGDGKSLLTDRMQPKFGTHDIWQLDLERGFETRLTSSPTAEFNPLLLADGKEMIYSAARSGTPNLVRRELLAGEEQVLLPSSGFQEAGGVSSAGDLIAFIERRERGGFRGYLLPLAGAPGAGGQEARALFPPDTEQKLVRLSGDGRHLAWVSAESGKVEAYAAPIENTNQRIRLSRQGAYSVRWRRDGREVFWLTPQAELIAAPVATEPQLAVGEPRVLASFPAGLDALDFDVDESGEKLMVLMRERHAGAQPASVILDWAP